MTQQRLKKSIICLGNVGLWMLAGLTLLVIVASFVPKVDCLLGSYRPLLVLTGSMEPSVPVGSLVVIRDVDPDTVRVGDVVTYRLTSRSGFDTEGYDTPYLTHRVKSVENHASGPRFITQGDANTTPDPLEVSPTQLLGRVVLVSSLAGGLVQSVRRPGGLVVLLLACLGVTALYRLRKRPMRGQACSRTALPPNVH